MKNARKLIEHGVLLSMLIAPAVIAQTSDQRLLTLDDLAAFGEVSDPQISPDGAWVVYAVTTMDMKDDKKSSDLWMTSWDGAKTVQLTYNKESEHTPRWRPDGRYLAFLSRRDVESETDQLWLLNREGGEAEKITDLEGGVTDYDWSPDGKKMALIVADPDEENKDKTEKTEKKTLRPIVVDRYQFKKDEVGYLRHWREHLYVLDLATRKAELLTPGDYDEYLPAWSPDNSSIVFVSKRGPDPDRHDNYDLYVIKAKAGATPRQLTTSESPDCHPDWESRPVWSPDGKFIAYLQGGPQKLIYYAVHELAVIPATGGAAKPVAPMDRNMYKPQWSADGSTLYFLLEEDRTTLLAKVSAAGGNVDRIINDRRVISAFDLAPAGKLVLLSSRPHEPQEVFALDNNTLRPLSRKNEALLARLKLGAVEEISFKSKDGTPINGFVVKPPDHVKGKNQPAILRIHGGPVSQFGHEFMFDWQLFAAHGYVVVGCNPRGSSGRGEKFSTEIYADWGNKDAQDVLAAVDHVVA
jgi:dipeptidyl aminopeptidase/acylaminoacyl peptidase